MIMIKIARTYKSVSTNTILMLIEIILREWSDERAAKSLDDVMNLTIIKLNTDGKYIWQPFINSLIRQLLPPSNFSCKESHISGGLAPSFGAIA